jgi:hypothetical protein
LNYQGQTSGLYLKISKKKKKNTPKFGNSKIEAPDRFGEMTKKTNESTCGHSGQSVIGQIGN